MDAVRFKAYFGIEVSDVVRQLKLMEPAYERILKVAVTGTSETLLHLEEAVRKNDFERAAGMAHEIKGVYANLRVTPLYELMADVDAHLRHGDEAGVIEPLLLQFREKFEQLKSLFLNEIAP